jgi:hypothetical protein
VKRTHCATVMVVPARPAGTVLHSGCLLHALPATCAPRSPFRSAPQSLSQTGATAGSQGRTLAALHPWKRLCERRGPVSTLTADPCDTLSVTVNRGSQAVELGTYSTLYVTVNRGSQTVELGTQRAGRAEVTHHDEVVGVLGLPMPYAAVNRADDGSSPHVSPIHGLSHTCTTSANALAVELAAGVGRARQQWRWRWAWGDRGRGRWDGHRADSVLEHTPRDEFPGEVGIDPRPRS